MRPRFANDHPWIGLAAAVVFPVLAAIAQSLLWPMIAPFSWLLFLPVVPLVAWIGGLGSAALATLLSTALTWFFFLPPERSFVKGEPRYLITAGLFIVIAYVGGVLADRLRRSARVTAAALDDAQRANQQLRESEERFRLAFSDAPIGMCLVSLDGHFARVNHRLCEIVGYSADELTKLDFQAITYQPDLDEDVALAHRLRAGEIPRYQLEKRYIRKDGRTVNVMLTVSVMRDRAGRPLYFISQIEDITERKRAEEALRLSEAKYSGIIAISEDAIVSVDENQRITLFNQGAEKIFGYSREEMIGAHHDLLVPERFRQYHRRQIEAFATGGVQSRRMGERAEQIFGLRKNGDEFCAEASISRFEVGGQRLLTVVMRDVTAANRTAIEQRFLADAGAALTSSLDYDETLTRLARLAVRDVANLCVIDAPDESGQLRHVAVVHSNPTKAEACERLARIDRAHLYFISSVIESRRITVWSDVNPEFLARVAPSAEWLEAFRELNPSTAMAAPLTAHGKLQGAILLAAGPSRRYLASDVPLIDEMAARIGLSIENARLYQNARRATQARDEVLGIVAHDLRNPLAAIKLAADVLQRQLAGSGATRGLKSVESIYRGVARSHRLIADLMDVTRAEAGTLPVGRARVAPLPLLDDVLETQQLLASAGAIELLLDAPPVLPEVCGDRDRLLQVMENLIGNAVRFTPAGGRITISADARGDNVLFRVADTGFGIPAEDLPHLFERFWRAKRDERSGAGLGLPICKAIIAAHGGRLWAESTPGQGTTFSFTVPIAPQLPEHPSDEQVAYH